MIKKKAQLVSGLDDIEEEGKVKNWPEEATAARRKRRGQGTQKGETRKKNILETSLLIKVARRAIEKKTRKLPKRLKEGS